MPKTIQIRELPDETYRELVRRAADAGMTVPELIRRLAEREVSRPSVRQWLERTRPGGKVVDTDVMTLVDELRGPWPEHADR